MTPLEATLSKHLLALGAAAEPTSVQEKWTLQQAWRTRFARNVHAATGKWSFQGCDWHAFSWRSRFGVAQLDAWEELQERRAAISRYLALTDREFLLIVDDDALPAYRCEAPRLPDLSAWSDWGQDSYVSAPDFAWTMVFTHEEGYGPYFARPTDPVPPPR